MSGLNATCTIRDNVALAILPITCLQSPATYSAFHLGPYRSEASTAPKCFFNSSVTYSRVPTCGRIG